MPDRLVICGSGPSANYCQWEWDTPIMAVSSGFDEAATFEHFVTLDRPICFPGWLIGSDQFVKHIPSGKFARFWTEHPRVRVWEYDFDLEAPDFTDAAGPLARGPQPKNHSLLFAVQVAALLGYERLIFLGVDLTSNELHTISDVMRLWWPAAQAAGVTWQNASPLSLLEEWMPHCETEEALVIT